VKEFEVVVFVLFLWVVGVGCQKTAKPAPKFEDYPADILRSEAAPLQFVTREEKAASTDIRNAIEKKREADGTKLKVPNFAGHYVIIEGPNAPDYMQAVIVDLSTGRIFQPPLAGQGGPHASYFSIPMDPFKFGGMDYRVDSRLLILPRSSTNRYRGYSTYYFVWDHETWLPIN